MGSKRGRGDGSQGTERRHQPPGVAGIGKDDVGAEQGGVFGSTGGEGELKRLLDGHE